MRWFRRLAVVLLISSGVNFVMIRLLRRRYPSAGDEQSDEIALAAIGTGIDLASRATAFRGGSARAMMGGLQLDLTGATPAPEGVRLELRAVMGGINVIVPPGWRITVEFSRNQLGLFLPFSPHTEG